MQAKYHTSTTSPSYTVLECEPHRLVDDLMYYIGANTLKMHRKWRFHNDFRPLVERKIARLTPEMDGATWLPERPTEAEQLEALRQAERSEQ